MNKEGQRVPGVTTIIGRFKDSGGLIWWASRLAFNPYLELRTLCESGAKSGVLATWLKDNPSENADFRAERDKAADVGTVCHAMVECHIRKRKFDPASLTVECSQELLIAARKPFESYKKWAKLSRLTPAHAETRLVSERFQYGGMVDAVQIDGELCIIDWKTSNSVYLDYILQVAAYRNLWNENNPKKKVTEGHLIRFGKGDKQSFAHHAFSEDDLDVAFQAFTLERALYDILKDVEKRLG